MGKNASDWKADLKALFEMLGQEELQYQRRDSQLEIEVEGFIYEVVRPAFEHFKYELEKYKREVHTNYDKDTARIVIYNEHIEEFNYTIMVSGRVPLYEVEILSNGKTHSITGAIGHSATNTLEQFTEQSIITHILKQYKEQIEDIGFRKN